MTENLEVDVVVVGAGPVGLTAANLLADYGVRVALLEREATISDEPRAISITDESLRVMDQLGVLAELIPEMLMDTGARYFGRKGNLLAEVRAKVPRLGHPVKSQFDQPILAELLLKASRARTLIELRFNAEVTSIEEQPGFALVQAGRGDQSLRVKAQWVLACDGGRSPVRTQLGIPLVGSTQEEKWIVVDVVNSLHKAEPFSQFHCNGTRPCVVVPGVKGRCRYEFMTLPGDDLATILEPRSVQQLVAPYQPMELTDIRRAAVYSAQQRVADTFRRGRIVLVGDAAHLMPPFAGQGINSGIRDAGNIAWKIAAHLKERGTSELVDSYEAERRPHVIDMVRLSHRIGKVVMATHPLATALRDSLVAVLGLVPAAKRWIVEMKFLKMPKFVTGCVVPATPSVPLSAAEMVGRSLPQPMVQRGDASLAKLDKVLGRGWSLIRFKLADSLQIQRAASTAAVQGLLENVIDQDGAFQALSGCDLVLLVRPDRYVAAAVAEKDLPACLQSLAVMVPSLSSQFQPLFSAQQAHQAGFAATA